MSLSEAAAAFRRGLMQPGTVAPSAPVATKEAATPEERAAEAVRLYDWQIRDLSQRLAGIRDPSEAAKLHARITEARAKLDAASAAAAKQGGDVTQHPQFAAAVGLYVEAAHATLEDAAGIALDGVPPEHVALVLAAARGRFTARLAALAKGGDVNAADASR